LLSPDLKFIEACLRCLRTIFTSPVTPEELLYTGPDHQTILFNHGAVQNIAHLLTSLSYKLDHDLKHAHELRQAAFKLYASLGANDEDIRKKVSLGEGRPPVLTASRQGVTST
ncbi:ARMC8 isoform 17, partial [Pan troglodytes]